MKIRPDTLVNSVVRGLNIMKILSHRKHGLNLTEISEKSNLPISTAHRLLITLESENYVQFEVQTKLWQIGVQAYIVGDAFEQPSELDELVDLTDQSQDINFAPEEEQYAP